MSVSSEILSGLFEHNEVKKFLNAAKRRFKNGDTSFARFHIDVDWNRHRYRDQTGRFISGKEVAAHVQQEIVELAKQQKLPWSIEVENLAVFANDVLVARGLRLTATTK